MDIYNIQAQVDQTEYWDENILDFKTVFFGDEAYSCSLLVKRIINKCPWQKIQWAFVKGNRERMIF